MQAEPEAAPEPQPQAEPEPEPESEPEGEPDEAAEAEPEPEPIPAVKPSVTASFEIRAAHGGKPVAAAAAGAALECDFRTYWSDVSDSIPRRLPVASLTRRCRPRSLLQPEQRPCGTNRLVPTRGRRTEFAASLQVCARGA